MQASIESWLNWLALRHSAATRSGYAWELRRLARWGPEKKPGDWSRDGLLSYLAERRATCGDSAIKRAVNALRSFFAFTRPGDSPAADLPAPRPKLRQQRTLTPEQAMSVLASCDTSTVIGVRDLALIGLMLDSGLRAAEVCRLAANAVDVTARVLRVIVKGGQEMFAVFSIETSNYLAGWLANRGEIAQPDVGTLFVGIGGLTPGRPLTPDGLRRIFHRVGRNAGLEHFSPHDLRRTFATLSTLLGAPSRILQLAGRWSDLSLVERYTRDLRLKAFEPYMPVAGLLDGRMDADAEP